MKKDLQSRGTAASIPPEEQQHPSIDSSSEVSGSIDPNDSSYFIQYQPEIAEKLSQHQSKYSVSGRCLSIVLSRMIFWSKYAKHRYQGKLFYYKNQGELSEETGFSIKTINRALKVLVELGLLIRNKFLKHRYYQCYFYHIPLSPHTKEIKTTRSKTSTTRRSRSTNSSIGAARPSQKVHSRAGASPASGAGADAYFPAAASRVFSSINTAVGASTPSGSADPAKPAGFGAGTINKGKGFGSKETICPIHNNKKPSNKKNTLEDIIQKCISYGNKDIYEGMFGIST
jgi:hypothetical protein